MLRVAVVEDEQEAREQVRAYLERYTAERGQKIEIDVFGGGREIAERYEPVFDIIFLDIEMPDMNGMEAARRIRDRDADVVLVFITNMGQYAIQGYSVGALDFVLKPLSYYGFTVKMDRAVEVAGRRASRPVILPTADGAVRLETRQIYYVEVQRGVLRYHTELGEFAVRGTLQSAEDALARDHFVRCNYWYLVNLRHVSRVVKDEVQVAGASLQISRRNRGAFMDALTDYVGGGT